MSQNVYKKIKDCIGGGKKFDIEICLLSEDGFYCMVNLISSIIFFLQNVENVLVF